MGRRIAPLTVDELPDLIECCRQCVFWELTPVDEARAHRAGQCALRKEQWVSHVLLEWGSCGQVAYVDGDAVGHVLYAPPVFFPRIASFPTAPMSPDAVALGSLRVREDYRGGGLARVLIQSMAADLVRRRVRAVEAIATVGTALNATADSAHRDADVECTVPTAMLLAVGFATSRAHARTPRLRLELSSTVTWREDAVAAALERLRSLRTPVGALRRDISPWSRT